MRVRLPDGERADARPAGKRAADVSGLLTTTLQLGQVVGVATFGSVFLTLAGVSSAHAITTTMTWAAVLLLVGAGFAVVLARTSVRR